MEKLLNRVKPPALPHHDSLSDLVESFSEIYVGKIEIIRTDLSELEATTKLLSCPPIDTIIPSATSTMISLNLLHKQKFSKSSKAHQRLDPFPTHVLVDIFF